MNISGDYNKKSDCFFIKNHKDFKAITIYLETKRQTENCLTIYFNSLRDIKEFAKEIIKDIEEID